MPQTIVPGVKTQHCVISDACREGDSDEGVIDTALAKTKESYMGMMESWPKGSGAKFHIVLTVNYGVAAENETEG